MTPTKPNTKTVSTPSTICVNLTDRMDTTTLADSATQEAYAFLAGSPRDSTGENGGESNDRGKAEKKESDKEDANETEKDKKEEKGTPQQRAGAEKGGEESQPQPQIVFISQHPPESRTEELLWKFSARESATTGLLAASSPEASKGSFWLFKSRSHAITAITQLTGLYPTAQMIFCTTYEEASLELDFDTALKRIKAMPPQSQNAPPVCQETLNLIQEVFALPEAVQQCLPVQEIMLTYKNSHQTTQWLHDQQKARDLQRQADTETKATADRLKKESNASELAEQKKKELKNAKQSSLPSDNNSKPKS